MGAKLSNLNHCKSKKEICSFILHNANVDIKVLLHVFFALLQYGKQASLQHGKQYFSHAEIDFFSHKKHLNF